jgi:nicotinate-nucleotide pyrophosphorylase
MNGLAPRDVVEAMNPDSDHATHFPFEWEDELREARALVAELIAADLEVDAAQAAIREAHKPGDRVSLDDPMVVRIQQAEERRAAALKGVQP